MLCSHLTRSASLPLAPSLGTRCCTAAGEMIIANDRYHMNETDTSLYAVNMLLVVKKLQKQDFGGYKCISKNSIGDADQTVRLYREYYTFIYI